MCGTKHSQKNKDTNARSYFSFKTSAIIGDARARKHISGPFCITFRIGERSPSVNGFGINGAMSFSSINISLTLGIVRAGEYGVTIVTCKLYAVVIILV